MHIEQAKQQLTAGRYLPAVRHAFARHWQQQQDFASWLDYMICKRQWGYALSSCHTQQALRWQQQPVWQRWWQGIYRHRARQLANLIAEAQCDSQTTPAIVKAYQQQVKCWRAQQQQNLQQLGQRLTSGSVAVVGNSPNLAGQQLGATIDRHDTVIRFNQFASQQTHPADLGNKLTIWVMAPGYHGPVPEQVKWIIVTGPDMLWWQQRWPQLNHHSAKVVSIPLEYWRQCVKQLQAPPSAGFLLLHWLQTMATPATLSIAGFGIDPNLPYHHAIKGHQAVSRHNWAAEHQQLSQWIRHNPL